jgi:hypothetical protein
MHRTNLRIVRESRLYNRTAFLEMHEKLRRSSVSFSMPGVYSTMSDKAQFANANSVGNCKTTGIRC